MNLLIFFLISATEIVWNCATTQTANKKVIHRVPPPLR